MSCHSLLKGASFCREENAILKNMSEEYNIIFCQGQITGELLSKRLKQRLAVFWLHYSLICTLQEKQRKEEICISLSTQICALSILAHKSFSQAEQNYNIRNRQKTCTKRLSLQEMHFMKTSLFLSFTYDKHSAP